MKLSCVICAYGVGTTFLKRCKITKYFADDKIKKQNSFFPVADDIKKDV